ncbi:MAG: response regulator [Chloroflexi bacterium]|nr:response regulator [Chloroflexota bacterium]
MPTPLSVLILEDRASDAELIVAELRHAGFDPQYERVYRRADYIARLTPALDVILADYSIPGFNAKRALRTLQECGLDIPFIVVSGTIEEESAVSLIRQGATDYLLKDRLARLGQAITRALEEKKLRHESARAEQALRENERHTHAELEQRAAELGALYDENLQLFEQVRASRERLQFLSRRLLQAQESERRNIARELHDEIGQALTGVQLNLQAIEPALARKSARATLQDAMATIERTLQQVRDLSLNLRPSILDDFGLVPALKWLVAQQMRRANLTIEFTPDPLEPRASIEIETACFRVVQEALTNTARHAHATHVSVRLQCAGPALKLVVQDDGTGFDTALALRRASGGASLGLLGLQERVSLAGGQIEIKSAPGQGTRIEARFPLDSSVAFIERRIRRRQMS